MMMVEGEVKESSLAALNTLREAGLSVIMARGRETTVKGRSTPWC